MKPAYFVFAVLTLITSLFSCGKPLSDKNTDIVVRFVDESRYPQVGKWVVLYAQKSDLKMFIKDSLRTNSLGMITISSTFGLYDYKLFLKYKHNALWDTIYPLPDNEYTDLAVRPRK